MSSESAIKLLKSGLKRCTLNTFSSENEKREARISVSVCQLEEDKYEVELNLCATINLSEVQSLKVELTYSGNFVLTNVDEGDQECILLVYAPSIIFPFAREIFNKLTSDAGIPTSLDLIDFSKLYENRTQAQKDAKTNI